MTSIVAHSAPAPTLSSMPKGGDLPEPLSAVASPEPTTALPGSSARSDDTAIVTVADRMNSGGFLTPSSKDPLDLLKQAAFTFQTPPAIYQRHRLGLEDLPKVPDWRTVKMSRGSGPTRHSILADHSMTHDRSSPKTSKVNKAKGMTSGRTYTSKYRGVHQTFPTKRWEAQFRRNGKPTSLGCFDHEEQAARAYDKMMLWCELHNTSGIKGGGITNFDPTEYEKDLAWLQTVTQEDLVQASRSEGRRQTAHGKAQRVITPEARRERMRAHRRRKKARYSSSGDEEDEEEMEDLPTSDEDF